MFRALCKRSSVALSRTLPESMLRAHVQKLTGLNLICFHHTVTSPDYCALITTVPCGNRLLLVSLAVMEKVPALARIGSTRARRQHCRWLVAVTASRFSRRKVAVPIILISDARNEFNGEQLASMPSGVLASQIRSWNAANFYRATLEGARTWTLRA